MTKTITATRRGRNGAHRLTYRNSNNRIAHDVERIIKKAMTHTGGIGLTKKVKRYLKNSLENAKDRTGLIHKDVANYTYKKPFTTLGLALLTGAAIALVVNKSIANQRHRRRFFG